MKVLFATDGSEFSKDALDQCVHIVQGDKANELRIISVFAPVVPATEPFAMSAEYIAELDEMARKQAEEIVSRAAAEVREKLPGSTEKITTIAVMGSPGRAIVQEAEDWGADLIVTGSHGLGFWKRALLGSVSTSIIHHAPCSVMVVRKKT